MIIYGYRSTHLKSEQFSQITCPYCGEKGHITSSIYGRYYHIFWIPFCSIGKRDISKCDSCENVIGPLKMPEILHQEYKRLKREASIPIWHWFGLTVAIIGIVISFFYGKINEKHEAEYISNPVAGDVYEYESGVNKYTTMKVTEVFGDSIYFVYNKYAFSTKDGIDKIEADSCYETDLYVMSKLEVKNMYDSKKIFDINRK